MKINLPRDLCEALRQNRASAKLSQAELARRSGVGQGQVCHMEIGKSQLILTNVLALLDELGLELHVLPKEGT